MAYSTTPCVYVQWQLNRERCTLYTKDAPLPSPPVRCGVVWCGVVWCVVALAQYTYVPPAHSIYILFDVAVALKCLELRACKVES